MSHATLFWWWPEQRSTKYYKVLQSTTKYCSALQGTTNYYSVLQSTTDDYCILQYQLLTTPVLLHTTKYYSLLLHATKYCLVLQSTTSVLLGTSMYCSVLQRTAPVLLRATKHSKELQSTAKCYLILVRLIVATDETSSTLCGATSGMQSTLELRHSCLIVATHETLRGATYGLQKTMERRHWCLIGAAHDMSFSLRGATGATLQHHQTLRLSRNTTLMVDPGHTWNAQYNARSNRSHPPTSPNIAPATKNHSDHWSSSNVQRPVHYAEHQESSSNFTKYCACHAKSPSWLILVT